MVDINDIVLADTLADILDPSVAAAFAAYYVLLVVNSAFCASDKTSADLTGATCSFHTPAGITTTPFAARTLAET
jgi:hypothetical protein